MEPVIPDADIHKKLFGDDFVWGVSTAAPQIEGAYNTDGKGLSIWDEFAHRKGKILNGDRLDIACDFYHHYKSDIDIIKSLKIPNFRFSIAWSRLLPDGTGQPNKAGIDFYNSLIDYCLEQEIEPWVTIYHWDLPLVLEQKGGWTNRNVVGWFTDYAKLCADCFGDRVKHWIIMNEPSAFTGAGYFLGIHAPGKMGLKNFLPAVHHTVLSIVSGAEAVRRQVPDGEIGITFSCSYIEPYSMQPKHVDAAKRVDALLNRLFVEVLYGSGYPDREITVLKNLKKYFLPGDEDKLTFDFDFVGIQNYTREIVKYSFLTPYLGASLVKARKRGVELTDMDWEVYPSSIYHMIKRFNGYKQIKKIYVTENGAAFPDVVSGNVVDDPKRIDFLKRYLAEVLKAKNEGLKISGYFIWTLTDNFEWAEGYKPKFGLIHVDFKTQQRIIKSSGYWYMDFLS